MALLAAFLLCCCPLTNDSPESDYNKHVAQLKQNLPAGFHVVIQKPFVVIGDDEPDVVEKWARGTVKWTVDRVKNQYFSKDPKHIVDIWLFKNKASYETVSYTHLTLPTKA